MPTVLHISTQEPAWWKKSAHGWESTTGPSHGPVWVVTDLPEEAFVEVTVPRIFGADRRNFVERQLSSRFPETAFRVALPPRSTGGLMERLAPPVQTLTAVEPADRILTALKTVHVPLAGVWSCSMLLTKMGHKSTLPKNLFVVLFHGNSMRILFLKQRAPVLTRLVAAAQTASEQAAEIVRTLRHLENTRVVERGAQRFGVLLLGGAPELAGALSSERLDVVSPPTSEGATAVSDWNHVLFDLACTNPPGQLAPLGYRASFLAMKVSKAARVGVALTAVVVLWLGSNGVMGSLHAQDQSVELQAQTVTASAQIGKIDIDLASFGTAPDLVRQALAVDTKEISSVPDFGTHMQILSQVISAVPGAQLKNMQWQLRAPEESVCVLGAGAAPPVVATDAAPDLPPSRKVELQIAVAFAGKSQPRLLTQQVTEVSRLLKQVQGMVVLVDPAGDLRDGVINIGASQAQSTPDMVWCATLPGTLVVDAQSPQAVP